MNDSALKFQPQKATDVRARALSLLLEKLFDETTSFCLDRMFYS